jgi:hypothetical protein
MSLILIKRKAKKSLKKKEFIELQEFYMDLIKHFSEFLSLTFQINKKQKIHKQRRKLAIN